MALQQQSAVALRRNVSRQISYYGLQKVAQNLDVLNAKIDRIMNVQHLHSVSLLSAIKSANETRLMCVADAEKKDEVYMQLQLSLRAIALSADQDLKELPFRLLPQMARFFARPERIEKLACNSDLRVKYAIPTLLRL